MSLSKATRSEYTPKQSDSFGVFSDLAMYVRTLRIDLPQGRSAFLWGPRKTGKSTLLRSRFPRAARFDLLDTRLLLELTRAPWTLSDRVRAIDRDTRGLPRHHR